MGIAAADRQNYPADAGPMALALQLAARGQGRVEPNPMVGAVLVSPKGECVGRGFHERFGGAHAEVHALAEAGARAQGATLYVTLEPCCHFGKTPPCADAVIAAGITRVVAAMADPFPRVAGGGFAKLRAAGIEVEVGVREAEARNLNAPYLKRLATGRPWVVGKWAMTLDGNIATHAGDSQWISGPESRAKVHELRGRVDAILVGRGTVEADDPRLTARLAPGIEVPRRALRVAVSGGGRLPERANLRSTAGEVPVRVYTAAGNEPLLDGWRRDGAEVVGLPALGGRLEWGDVLAHLGATCTNVLAEGGGRVLRELAAGGHLDEVWAFLAPKLLGGTGLPPLTGLGVAKLADAAAWRTERVEACGGDALLIARRAA